MDLNFAIIVFCVTLVALVAIARGNDAVALKAIQTLAELKRGTVAWVQSFKAREK